MDKKYYQPKITFYLFVSLRHITLNFKKKTLSPKTLAPRSYLPIISQYGEKKHEEKHEELKNEKI